MALLQHAYPNQMNQLPNRSTSHVELMITASPGRTLNTILLLLRNLLCELVEQHIVTAKPLLCAAI